MSDLFLLRERRILALEGPDAKSLLQGLITNDVDRLKCDAGLYAALLTPQGKVMFDFLLAGSGESVLIDCEWARSEELMRRLMMYRLRKKVDLSFRDDWAVAALIEGPASRPEGAIVFRDPRHEGLGRRILAPADALNLWAEVEGLGIEEDAVYRSHRIALGIPEGEEDFGSESMLALEADLDLLNGVDFDKGCYVGQELTARTHYRGKVRYRLYPVDIEGEAPQPGSNVVIGDKVVGTLCSVAGHKGIARLRSEDLSTGMPQAGTAKLTVRPIAGEPADG